MNQTTAAARQADSRFFHPRRLGHANLFVSDYERAFEFYNKVAGFHEVYRQPDNQASFVSNGNTYHDLGLTDIRSHYRNKGQRPGLWHLALETETEADLVSDYRAAVAAGVEFAFCMDHDAAHSIYKYDPDGNLVELYADVEKDWRAFRHGIIIKEKPEWIPGVTSPPKTERNYPQNAEIQVVKEAIFHPKHVTHVAFVAKNFEAMFKYYTEIIGLEPVLGDPRGSFAVLRGSAGKGDVTLYRLRDGLAPGMHHVGFVVWDEADLGRSVAALHAAGMQPEREVDHPARRSVVIKDPDGIRLQFYVDRDWTPATLASISDEMALDLL
jgi:catechol 2,3-dioxygenase